MNSITSPVPLNQQPLQEFKQLSTSWFFSWAITKNYKFYRSLTFCWMIFLPIAITISYGSIDLQNRPLKLYFLSCIASLVLPSILLIRQWLSWNYVYKRLKSVIIEYEESGWYDGQIWEKPTDWREKDLLIAQHEVKPALDRIKKGIYFILTITFIAIISFRFLEINYI